MSDEKRETIIKEIVELYQSGVDYHKALEDARKKYKLDK